ncbi:beta-lactamase-like protein [Mycena rebaudengoi]|nr:beta-lactamase-like protein [Mycena rebaudengoi]
MAETLQTPDASLPPPAANQAYMHISALEAGIIHLPFHRISAGEPSNLVHACPSLAFFLKHSSSERHLIFDLGLRRDLDSYPPAIQPFLRIEMPCEVPQTVEESCIKGGVDPVSVETVVISHLHFDHVGDASAFPNASFIIGGGGKAMLENGYPENPESPTLSASTPADRTSFFTDAHFSTSIGPSPRAHDYFGDGSVYIIDTPGHCSGHITLLARTSADGAWLYLGADVAHDTRLLTGETQIATVDAYGSAKCMHEDAVQAATDIARVHTLLQLPRVDCIIAHDWKWYEEHQGRDSFLPSRIAALA